MTPVYLEALATSQIIYAKTLPNVQERVSRLSEVFEKLGSLWPLEQDRAIDFMLAKGVPFHDMSRVLILNYRIAAAFECVNRVLPSQRERGAVRLNPAQRAAEWPTKRIDRNGDWAVTLRNAYELRDLGKIREAALALQKISDREVKKSLLLDILIPLPSVWEKIDIADEILDKEIREIVMQCIADTFITTVSAFADRKVKWDALSSLSSNLLHHGYFLMALDVAEKIGCEKTRYSAILRIVQALAQLGRFREAVAMIEKIPDKETRRPLLQSMLESIERWEKETNSGIEFVLAIASEETKEMVFASLMLQGNLATAFLVAKMYKGSLKIDLTMKNLCEALMSQCCFYQMDKVFAEWTADTTSIISGIVASDNGTQKETTFKSLMQQGYLATAFLLAKTFQNPVLRDASLKNICEALMLKSLFSQVPFVANCIEHAALKKRLLEECSNVSKR